MSCGFWKAISCTGLTFRWIYDTFLRVDLTVLFFCFFLLQGPCHIELHGALDTISSAQQKMGEKFTTFYLPNCDKHGFYKAKQVRLLWYDNTKCYQPAEGDSCGSLWVTYSCGFPSAPLFQCESSLVGPPARCWCVSPWNGKKIPGSSDLLSDSDCHQEGTH